MQAWFGGLVDGMRDASGQSYMRNGHYDPATGQCTQTDLTGLAGGQVLDQCATIPRTAQPETVRRDTGALIGLCCIATVGALYGFAGYAMNASFSVPGNHEVHSRAAVIWGGAGMASMTVAMCCALALWKRSRGK